jgi:V8-like Glu-specific endopeptidase
LVEFKSGRVSRGSGAFIGPNQILTAGHILFNRDCKVGDLDNVIE